MRRISGSYSLASGLVLPVSAAVGGPRIVGVGCRKVVREGPVILPRYW